MTLPPENQTPDSGLNLIQKHWAERLSPLIAGKAAVTLDGRTATRHGDSQWITGPAARDDVMRWRRRFPAIAVGSGTIIDDNPRLTSRTTNEPEWCPLRFIFDGRQRTLIGKAWPRVYTDEFRERTILVTTGTESNGALARLRDCGVQVWTLPSDTSRVKMADFRRRCAQEEIRGVYVEGGSHLLGEFLAARELDYFFLYRAPILLGDNHAQPFARGLKTARLADAIQLADVQYESFGTDLLTRGRVVYPDRAPDAELPAKAPEARP